MTDNFTVFAVDDDPMALDLIRLVLEPRCRVETFTSAEACMARLADVKPDMFLLDVRMPGIDGYEFCRHIKGEMDLRATPVTFVSSQDTIDARLAGYDAGGDDFILKPFAAEELERKTRVAAEMLSHASRIRQQLNDAELLSSLVMANIDEYAILIRFLRELLGCEDEESVAGCLLDMLERFRLDGAIQVRSQRLSLTVSQRGTDLPLEASIVRHVRGMDRIFEFRNRSVHNFEHVTLLVNNMPLHDPECCGRLRDHLCIAIESAEARVRAIEVEDANQRKNTGIRTVLQRIRNVTDALSRDCLRDLTATSDLLLRLEHSLSKCFVSLGLSDAQEREVSDVIALFSDELTHIFDHSADASEPLQQITHELNRLLTMSGEQTV